MLQATTEEKAQQLFDANRSDLYAQSYADLSAWISEIEEKLKSDVQGKDLTSVNILLKNLKVSNSPPKDDVYVYCWKSLMNFLHKRKKVNLRSMVLTIR